MWEIAAKASVCGLMGTSLSFGNGKFWLEPTLAHGQHQLCIVRDGGNLTEYITEELVRGFDLFPERRDSGCYLIVRVNQATGSGQE